MSAIDELKNPTLILDSTGNESDTPTEGVYIDASSEDNSSDRVDLSSLNKTKGVHQIINQNKSPSLFQINRGQYKSLHKSFTLSLIIKYIFWLIQYSFCFIIYPK